MPVPTEDAPILNAPELTKLTLLAPELVSETAPIKLLLALVNVIAAAPEENATVPAPLVCVIALVCEIAPLLVVIEIEPVPTAEVVPIEPPPIFNPLLAVVLLIKTLPLLVLNVKLVTAGLNALPPEAPIAPPELSAFSASVPAVTIFVPPVLVNEPAFNVTTLLPKFAAPPTVITDVLALLPTVMLLKPLPSAAISVGVTFKTEPLVLANPIVTSVRGCSCNVLVPVIEAAPPENVMLLAKIFKVLVVAARVLANVIPELVSVVFAPKVTASP